MKRSQKLSNHARRATRRCLGFLGLGVSLGVFAAVVGMGEGPGGALALMLAAAAIPPGWIAAGDALRLSRMANEERRWERAGEPELKL